MEHSAVRRRAQKRDQARQRGLRGQVRLGGQRRGASRPACSQTQARVIAERIRIVLVPPALAKKEKRRAQQIGKRIDDPISGGFQSFILGWRGIGFSIVFASLYLTVRKLIVHGRL